MMLSCDQSHPHQLPSLPTAPHTLTYPAQGPLLDLKSHQIWLLLDQSFSAICISLLLMPGRFWREFVRPKNLNACCSNEHVRKIGFAITI